MANYTYAVFNPYIPKNLITEGDRRIIEAFGISMENAGFGNVYLCTNNLRLFASLESEGEEKELDINDLYSCFQGILRHSNGELTWISQETAHTCSHSLHFQFGGRAFLITADEVQYVSTSEWLRDRIIETTTGGTGPKAEDPEASVPQDEKPLFC